MWYKGSIFSIYDNFVFNFKRYKCETFDIGKIKTEKTPLHFPKKVTFTQLPVYRQNTKKKTAFNYNKHSIYFVTLFSRPQ